MEESLHTCVHSARGDVTAPVTSKYQRFLQFAFLRNNDRVFTLNTDPFFGEGSTSYYPEERKGAYLE